MHYRHFADSIASCFPYKSRVSHLTDFRFALVLIRIGFDAPSVGTLGIKIEAL